MLIKHIKKRKHLSKIRDKYRNPPCFGTGGAFLRECTRTKEYKSNAL